MFGVLPSKETWILGKGGVLVFKQSAIGAAAGDYLSLWVSYLCESRLTCYFQANSSTAHAGGCCVGSGHAEIPSDLPEYDAPAGRYTPHGSG